jgi:hypothetical protein
MNCAPRQCTQHYRLKFVEILIAERNLIFESNFNALNLTEPMASDSNPKGKVHVLGGSEK